MGEPKLLQRHRQACTVDNAQHLIKFMLRGTLKHQLGQQAEDHLLAMLGTMELSDQ